MKNEILFKKVCVRTCTGHAELCQHNQTERDREREVTQLTCGTNTETDLLVDRLR